MSSPTPRPSRPGEPANAAAEAVRMDVGALADAMVELGRLALAFGLVNRTAVHQLDGTPESDTDHTVMLAWVACSLAALRFPGLDVGLVAQYALVHDAPEVHAGDTPTLRIDAAGRAAKADRERAAAARLHEQFADRLPWLPRLVGDYERQDTPEARFVRGLDKIMPKIVHLLDGCAGLHEHGMGRAELTGVFEVQQADMERYVGDFDALMAVREELVGRVLDRLGPGRRPAGETAGAGRG